MSKVEPKAGVKKKKSPNKEVSTDAGSRGGQEAVSKAEVDALLTAYQAANATASGHQAEKEVRLYDFNRPGKCSKEHLRTLSVIHSNFAAAITTALPAFYHAPTKVNFLSVDQLIYKEYRESLPAKTMFAAVGGEPLSSDIFFEVNPGIVGAWVDYLCGGSAMATSEPSELTPTDLAIARTVLTGCLRDYADCWSDTIPLHPEIRKVVDSGSGGQLLLPSEPVVVCSFEMQVGNSKGSMTICIPSTSMELVLPALSMGWTQQSSRRESRAAIENLEKSLKQVNLLVRVVLGGASVSLAEVAGLEIGDIIKTNRRTTADAELWIGDRRMFNCRPGINGKMLAVLLSGPVEPVEEPVSQDVAAEAQPEDLENAA